MARALRAEGRPTAALELVERALRLAPHWCEAHLDRLALLRETGAADRAAELAGELPPGCDDVGEEPDTGAVEEVR